MPAVIGKVDSRRLKQHRHFRCHGRLGLCLEPGAYLRLLLRGQFQLRQIGRTHSRCERYVRIFKCRDIQRFPHPALWQQIAAQQRIRIAVIFDVSVSHNDHAIHRPVEHILDAVFDDDNGAVCALLDLIDQDDGLFACGRVEVCQRLIKEQNVHIIYHHAAKPYPLFLTAGDLMGRVVQHPPHVYEIGDFFNLFVHLRHSNAVIFQRKGNVFRHSQADELTVGVLQYGADDLGKIKESKFQCILAANREGASDLTGIGVRYKTVDTVRKRGLAAARGTGNQHLFATANLQVNVVECRFSLRCILKAKMLKRD